MGNLSNNLVYKSFLIILVLISSYTMYGQDTGKSNYAEIIIKQKGSGEFQSISLNSISSSAEKTKIEANIAKLKSSSAVLKYMNSENWEFIDRKAVLWGSVIWVNLIFKKRTE